jgi:hypothetical protein
MNVAVFAELFKLLRLMYFLIIIIMIIIIGTKLLHLHRCCFVSKFYASNSLTMLMSTVVFS